MRCACYAAGVQHRRIRQQDVPEFILEKVGDRADLEIQLSLANNATTSANVLKKLTTSKNFEIVEAANLHVNLAGELTEGYEEKTKKAIEQKLKNRYDRNFKFQYLQILSQICSFPDFIIKYLVKSNSDLKIWENLAKSPATMPSILELLANFSNHNIKSNLVKNYCTPVNTLRLILKDLNWIDRANLASKRQTPVDILEQLAKDTDSSVRRKAAENLNTPINILADLVQDSDGQTAINALRNIAIKNDEYHVFLTKYAPNAYIKNSSQDESIYNIPTETLEKIIHKNPMFVAGHFNTAANLLLELSQHKNFYIRQQVAENLKIPVHILEELAYDENSSVRCSVARHPNISLKILFKELIRNSGVNSAIAYQLSSRTSECPEIDKIRDILAEESASNLETILQRLIDDGEVQARIFLASRADLPVNLLRQLAQKTEPEVQEAVAKNPNTPTSSLEELANNQKAEVRQAVARHPKTSSDILAILADDDSPIVRASAMSNPNLPKESIEQILCGKYAAEYPQYNPDFLKNNPDSLALVLNYYAKSQFQLVSYIALLQPQVSQQILEEKSLSVSWLNRFAVAQNINTSSEILQKLAEDSNQLVRVAAKKKLLSK